MLLLRALHVVPLFDCGMDETKSEASRGILLTLHQLSAQSLEEVVDKVQYQPTRGMPWLWDTE